MNENRESISKNIKFDGQAHPAYDD